MIWFLSQILSHTTERWHHVAAPSGPVRPLHFLASMWGGGTAVHTALALWRQEGWLAVSRGLLPSFHG